jgi:CO dehydrogenase/acetyl-CoA synthase gamma subunit (corrinoid Fe-S protein)
MTRKTKLFTVTKGNSPADAVTFGTDDIEDTRADAPFVVVSLNFALTAEMLEADLAGKEP